MQFRIYNRKTLEYRDGGYVSSYTIDDDYIVNNNSKIYVVKKKRPDQSTIDTRRLITIGGRNYYGYITNSTIYWGLVKFIDAKDNLEYIDVLLVSTDKKSVKYWTDYDYTMQEWPYSADSNIGVININGIKYYFSSYTQAMPSSSEITNNLYRLKIYDVGKYDYQETAIRYAAQQLLDDSVHIVAPKPHVEEFLQNVVVGDIIVLIKDSGVFHKGVITSFDSTDLSILYKSDKELFNDNIINPLRTHEVFLDDDESNNIAGKVGIDYIVGIFDLVFAQTDKVFENEYKKDPLKTLPIIFETNGNVVDSNGNPKILWTWSDNSINLVDWLVELFEKYNITLSWTIDFNISESDIYIRKPKYIVTFSAITNGGNIIKDNVDMQDITYTTQELPESTVCYVIDSETKEIILENDNINLLNPYNSQTNTILDGNHNTYHNTNEPNSTGNTLSGYIPVSPTSKDENGIEKFNEYTFTVWNTYDINERWVWCYDKSKTRICGISYRIINRDVYSMPLSPRDIVFGYKSINYKYAQKNDDGTYKRDDDGNLVLITETKEETQEEVKNRIAKSVRYIRICYPAPNNEYQLINQNQKVQYEKTEIRGTHKSFDEFNQPAIYYLYEKNGIYDVVRKNVSENSDDNFGSRVAPSKTVVAELNTTSESENPTTPKDVAKEKLIPSQFNQAIEIKINSDSKVIDLSSMNFGDMYKIINEHGTIDSIFTGKKMSSKEKTVTLYFGLGRQNYTDIMQIRLRKQRYTEVYNQ